MSAGQYTTSCSTYIRLRPNWKTARRHLINGIFPALPCKIPCLEAMHYSDISMAMEVPYRVRIGLVHIKTQRLPFSLNCKHFGCHSFYHFQLCVRSYNPIKLIASGIKPIMFSLESFTYYNHVTYSSKIYLL